MRYRAIALLFLICATHAVAQNVYDVYPERDRSQTASLSEVRSQTNGEGEKGRNGEEAKGRKGNGVFTGFTGGMKLHIGYAFSQSPDELFRNGSLENISNLPKDGITLGLGGELRLHLFRHLHLGAEGGVSTMPLMKSGSSIRTGWGGLLFDYYGQAGKATLFIGGMVGGGTTKRLYVPDEAQTVSDANNVAYNSSYTSTPFFLLDPYIGMEFGLSKRMSLMIQIDYMLPFGKGDQGISTETIRWSNFLSPSGPRLYVGLMFGKHDRRQERR